MVILTRTARTDSNLTLIQLAKLTGISKSTLSNIENGKVSPKIAQLETIAKSLELKISELVKSQYMVNVHTSKGVMDVLTWKARTDNNLTLIQMAKLTGISKSTLNNIENGKVSPKIAQLEAIAKSLEMQISELVQSEYM